jgi:hypothetical protein
MENRRPPPVQPNKPRQAQLLRAGRVARSVLFSS